VLPNAWAAPPPTVAPAPPGPIRGVNPKVETTPGARTTVVRYGPFIVPPARGSGHNDAGMLQNHPGFGAPMPCQDCFITGFRPQLLDVDGRVANYDTGAVLHHFIIFGSGKTDPTCGDVYGALGTRVLAGANDRTQAMFPKGTGYHIAPSETWLLIADLMNMTTQPRPMVLEMAYDWVPASTPDMQGARPVWLDVGPCGQSWVPADRGRYSRRGSWSVNVPGRVLGLAGHLHDGGTHIEVRNGSTGRQARARGRQAAVGHEPVRGPDTRPAPGRDPAGRASRVRGVPTTMPRIPTRPRPR
jgi:hypothetical protein